jgi:lipopolysaccharide biosynthesis glycosyltransferase
MFMAVDHLNIEIKPADKIKTEPIVVVCAADDNYAMPLAVTVRSALENLKSQHKMLLFIIDGDISNRNKQKILKSLKSENCEVKFIPKPDYLLKMTEFEYIEKYHVLSASGAALYRLMISELLPRQFDKAIYLDCDLVIKGSLEELWETDLAENYVLAVQDMLIQYVSSPCGLLNYQELGISPDAKYFNSGVLVINLKKWRDDKITIKAIEYLKHNRKYVRWHDQDVLNALFASQWGELHPQWNFMVGIYEYSFSKESTYPGHGQNDLNTIQNLYNNLVHNPYIIHFTSGKKPWNSRKTLLKEYFFEYLDMTVWSNWRLTLWRQIWIKLITEFHQFIRPISN